MKSVFTLERYYPAARLQREINNYCEAHNILLSINLSMAPKPSLNLGRFFSFLFLYTFGRIPWTGDQSLSRQLPRQNNTNTEKTQANIHGLSDIQTHDPSV
jgi:hypothetical protein